MNLLDYVHITQGTASQPRFSNGNTLPLTQLPFGMNAFAPQTQKRGSWFYHPNDRSLEGVRLTHQASPWIEDFGTFVMMPQAGEFVYGNDARWSSYRPEDAVLMPHYMRLEFLRSRSIFELVPTERGAVIRLGFSEEKWQPYFSILRHAGNINIQFEEERNIVKGEVDYAKNSFKAKDSFRLYFVFKFENGFSAEKSIKTDDEGWLVALNSRNNTIRLGTSYIGYEQAERNLETEASEAFEEIYEKAENEWKNKLSTIEIETENPKILNTFYTCLYRVFTYPNKMYELDDNKEPIHYDVYSGTVKKGVLYTNNGFWDTYRTVYPLLSLIDPEMNKEILKGFLQIYRNLGWLPRWNALCEANCMPGTLIDAVLADGAVKGLLDKEDLELALEGMLKHAEEPCEGFLGRAGIKEYTELGYVPRDIHESVNCNQDYAYGDWCIAQVARLCGKEDIAERYEKRAQNYKNLFDPETGFMRSRDRDGSFLPAEEFDPFAWGGDYTEGSAWQNSFAVFHDFEGLAELYGGKKKLIAKLDELFSAPQYYSVNGYALEIHEMTEMAVLKQFGQCAISNQPSFHLPWIFAELDEKSKTDYWVERLVNETFDYTPDGFPGDEDNGTMSAWYIFAVMGFYPLCPGKTEYIRSKQLADRIKIRGKEISYKNVSKYFSYFDLTK